MMACCYGGLNSSSDNDNESAISTPTSEVVGRHQPLSCQPASCGGGPLEREREHFKVRDCDCWLLDKLARNKL